MGSSRTALELTAAIGSFRGHSLSGHSLPDLAVPDLAIPYPAVPYLAIPCLIWPCLSGLPRTDPSIREPFASSQLLFYDLPMCSRSAAAESPGFAVRLVDTAGACGEAEVYNHSSAGALQPLGEMRELGLMLRLDDGFELGKAYLPVFVLGPAQYALLTVSLLDSKGRSLFEVTELTVQLGPDERFPWIQGEEAFEEENDAYESVLEDIIDDLGEDLIEDLQNQVSDLIESVSEDALDEIVDFVDTIDAYLYNDTVDDANETAAARLEELSEKAEEEAEEQAEEQAEEEEDEREAAFDAGLLSDLGVRKTFFSLAATFNTFFNMDIFYFRPSRMAAEPVVPGAYTEAGVEKEYSQVPYYYGARAVKSGRPILVATSEHYVERKGPQMVDSCTIRNGRRVLPWEYGPKALKAGCNNVYSRVLPVDGDRYELVPALALKTPIDTWRWPLQLRILTARVYTNLSLVRDVLGANGTGTAEGANATVRGGEPVPFLVHFDPAGFKPQLAYSDDGVARQKDKVPRLWEALVIFVLLVMVTVIFCGEFHNLPSAAVSVLHRNFMGLVRDGTGRWPRAAAAALALSKRKAGGGSNRYETRDPDSNDVSENVSENSFSHEPTDEVPSREPTPVRKREPRRPSLVSALGRFQAIQIARGSEAGSSDSHSRQYSREKNAKSPFEPVLV